MNIRIGEIWGATRVPEQVGEGFSEVGLEIARSENTERGKRGFRKFTTKHRGKGEGQF